MKTFILTLSKNFPKTHKRAGEKTNFSQKLQLGIKNIPNSVMYDEECDLVMDRKIHTIRSNFDLWSKRIEQVQKGEAILSIRYWSGKPYNSPQIKILELDQDSGIGVQAIVFPDNSLFNSTICGPEFPKSTWYKGANISELSKKRRLIY